jgi:hypothetical protein
MQKTCTVDGVKYRAVENTHGCQDCAAVWTGMPELGNSELCGKLPLCHGDDGTREIFISWIKVIPRKKTAANP